MLERGKMERGVVEFVDTESLVPEGHLLRKVDRAVDFGKLYKIVESLTKSTTDPDCGILGQHQRQYAYEAHTACDKNGYVLETVVTPAMSMIAWLSMMFTIK